MVGRRCLSSYTNQNELSKHKQRFELQEITSIRTSKESRLYWKKTFRRIYYSLGFTPILKLIMKLISLIMVIKQPKFIKKNPVCNAHYIISEVIDVLQSG